MRFFFDYTSENQVALDYRGEEFSGPDAATEFAEAIAQDMRVNISGDWIGWSVEVRNIVGKKIVSLAIDATELIAA